MPRFRPDRGAEPDASSDHGADPDASSDHGADPDAGRGAGELDSADDARAHAGAAGDAAACRDRALGLLARREHSRLELSRKLAARGFTEDVIDAALDALERCGALAAERFVESFVRSRAARGHGPLKIAAELAQRGIASGEISAALASAELDWAELAAGVRAKRFGAARPESFDERARQSRFLQQRGFAAEQIRAALAPRED